MLLLLFSALLLLPLLLALSEDASNTLAGGGTSRQTADRLPVIHGSVDALVGNEPFQIGRSWWRGFLAVDGNVVEEQHATTTFWQVATLSRNPYASTGNRRFNTPYWRSTTFRVLIMDAL